MKKIKTLLFSALFLITGLFSVSQVSAAADHSINFVQIDGTMISSQTINDGDAIGTLPVETDLYLWIDQYGTVVTETTMPTEDLTVTAIHTSDLDANGTMDSGNIYWFIYDEKLVVTGTGTIDILDRVATDSTKRYGLALNSISINNPSISYDWVSAPSSDNDDTFCELTIPTSQTTDVLLNISRPISFSGETISYPASALADAAPWLAYAEDISSMTYASTVSLTGNYTLYFNQNSESVTPTELKESVYTNLEIIYLYSDTSGIERMSGMFARIPKLSAVYTKAGQAFDTSKVVDISAIFYGDESLTCTDTTTHNSVINHFSDTSKVIDARYAFFGDKSLVKPQIGHWDVSNFQDMSYMLTGCVSAKLTCGVDNSSSDLQNWAPTNVYSTVCMFAGPNIDLSLSNPITSLWGHTSSNVVIGDFDLSQWGNLPNLKVSVYMFAQNAGLKSVSWNIDAPVLQDASCMLAWISSLEEVDFSSLNTPQLVNTVCMLFGSGAEDAVANFTSWNISALEDARYMLYNTTFTDINFDGTNPSNLVYATGMFGENLALRTLGNDALQTWRLIRLKDGSYMFYNCPLLSVLNVSDWGMDVVENLSYFISDCSSLSILNVSRWNISNSLTDISCFAYNANKIITLLLENWDMSGVVQAPFAFAKMSLLETLSVKDADLSSLENAYAMCAYDYSLKEINFGTSSGLVMENAGGMFYNCTMIKRIIANNLICDAATNISYFASGCINLIDFQIANWNTSNVEYFQCCFDSLSKLSEIVFGTNFTTGRALSTAKMFRHCSVLSDTTLQTFINIFVPNRLVNASEMFNGCMLLTNIDYSNKDFSTVQNVSRMHYQNNAASTITLPVSFASAVTDMSNCGNQIFFVDNDTLTFLTIKASTLPAVIADYAWDADNRVFLIHKKSTINGTETTSFAFNDASAASAAMKLEITSTCYLDNLIPVPLAYTWKNGATPLAETTNCYTVDNTGEGSYTCTASLSGMNNTGSLSDTFTISKDAGIIGLLATYNGPVIVIGNEYSTDDLLIQLKYDNGTLVTLSPSDYTLDSMTVSSPGNNTFSVVHTTAVGKSYSTTFNVQGKRIIGSIEAIYSGPDVRVGSSFDPDYITCIAYYADDTAKTDGFEVTPSSFSGYSIATKGNNTFTAYYIDAANNNNKLSDTFTVYGYSPSNIASITATYTGPSILVGNIYDRNYVEVRINYNDGTASTLTTQFSLSSVKVSSVGSNIFEASYVDENGRILSDTFSVTGYVKSAAPSKPSAPTPVTSPNVGVKTGDTINLYGIIMMIVGLILILSALVCLKLERRKNS